MHSWNIRLHSTPLINYYLIELACRTVASPLTMFNCLVVSAVRFHLEENSQCKYLLELNSYFPDSKEAYTAICLYHNISTSQQIINLVINLDGWYSTGVVANNRGAKRGVSGTGCPGPQPEIILQSDQAFCNYAVIILTLIRSNVQCHRTHRGQWGCRPSLPLSCQSVSFVKNYRLKYASRRASSAFAPPHFKNAATTLILPTQTVIF